MEYLRQIVFGVTLLITLGVFAYTTLRIASFFKLSKGSNPISDWGKRIGMMMKVAIGQSKIFRFPLTGFLHAIVFWGFMVILVGSIEMVIDGLTGTERVLAILGPVYDFLIATGDVFGLLIALSILVFLFRRLFMHVKRFYGVEMKKVSKQDANLALTFIFLLMLSLLGMNTFYVAEYPETFVGVYPVSEFFASFFANMDHHTIHVWHEINWWAHILLIFIFANMLPYSKHFHVFMSVPNVLLARLEPLGWVRNMENITKEVKMMMDPDAAFAEPAEGEEEAEERFGAKDVEDLSWKNYMDSLACTECGRCTSVCPANTTGKLLSPRKVVMDTRARMKEKGPKLAKDNTFDDNKSLLRDYLSDEELWACTMCNACAQECPININHPSIILELRRFIVMEEAAAPGEINTIFSNIENNGAPWQYSQEDRMLWADNLEMNKN